LWKERSFTKCFQFGSTFEVVEMVDGTTSDSSWNSVWAFCTLQASKGLPAFSVYAASKAALRAFVRSWSVDLKGRNIRDNVVAPDTVVTPAYEQLLTDEQIAGSTQQAVAAALGRVGTPDEIATTAREQSRRSARVPKP
jgi:NAD(P)-dependent dehydrogenase (short-subunit alcohol dehydrogenase family)